MMPRSTVARAPQSALTPEERHADLLVAADMLGASDTAAEAKSALSRAIADDYSSEEVALFLLQEWKSEEEKRRWREKMQWRTIYGNLFFSIVGALGLMLAVILNRVKHFGHLSENMGYGWVCCIYIGLVFILAQRYLAAKEKRSRGFAALLMVYGDARHTGCFVDTLNVACDGPVVKTRLTTFLPRYHATDAPPLDKYQQRTLLRELKQELARAKNPEALTDSDTAYLCALLRYFEREAARGVELPTKTEPALREWTNAPSPRNYEGVVRWRQIHEAAEDCLVRVQGAPK